MSEPLLHSCACSARRLPLPRWSSVACPRSPRQPGHDQPVHDGLRGVHFDSANPSAGSFLNPGGLVVEGIALDSRATSGNGIDRVDFFLGNRDEGGMSVGMAVPGATAGPFGTGSFHTIVELPKQAGGTTCGLMRTRP